MPRITAIVLLMGALAIPARAQSTQASVVTGTTMDGGDQTPLPGVNVVLTSVADSSRRSAAISDAQGFFTIRVPALGAYRLRASFVGYGTLERPVSVDTTREDLGVLTLAPGVTDLDEVVVEDVQERFRMRGDTTIFNADAFKVNPDATAEDLITKMPGVVLQDGQVQAQGEQVQRVTVDGREFFGNDPTVALRNLPADVIQSVEVFDRQSDQAQFTGFNDGNTEKTINIITRTGMNNGQFGKVYGGYGQDERYITGGNVNIFDGDRRISLIGLANNVNQQNFAFEDLLGMSGGGGFRGGPPRGGMMIRGGGGSPRGGVGGFRGGGGGGFNPRDFLVGQQRGLNSTSSLGLNYSDDIGSKLELSGSYFFNRMGNANEALLDRQLFLADEQSQFYSEQTQATSTNYNHRLNARIEYEIDENNSLMVRPSLSFQDNTSASVQSGSSILNTGAPLNESFNNYVSDNFGFTSSTDILYRHRFAKQGRTVSANLEVGLNDRWGDTDQLSVTEFFSEGSAAQDSTYDQEIDTESAGRSASLDVDFTEPIGSGGQLRLSYEPSYGKNVSDRSAYVLDLQTGRYTILDPTFSSLFDNDVFTQRGGVTYQKRVEDKYDFNVGVEYQNERLLGDQTYPIPFNLDRTFHSILPEARIGFDFGEGADLRFFYRTSTNTPSVSQLQDVIDNTNPLFLTTGNPDLSPSYSHSLNMRFRRGDWRAGRMLFGFVNVNYQLNPIGTASLLAVRDTVLARGVSLQQGSQLSYPVNLNDPSMNARSFLVLGTPFPLLKSNLNLRGGFSFSRSPGLINDMVNMATQYGLNGGATIGSNISERLDFTLSYGADYTVAANSFYEQLDENYFRHDAGIRFTWLPLGGLTLETNLTYNDYAGLDEELYPSTLILNAGVGYKFLQQDAAELKLVVGDIFNQETGINRSITEMYIEDSRTQVLGRYILLNLSYRLRNFRM